MTDQRSRDAAVEVLGDAVRPEELERLLEALDPEVVSQEVNVAPSTAARSGNRMNISRSPLCPRRPPAQ